MARPTIYPQLYGSVLDTTDNKVSVSANDASSGYLLDKLEAGTNITLTETNDGLTETVVISCDLVQSPPVTVSATEPLDPTDGDLWWDTSTLGLFVFDTTWQPTQAEAGTSVVVSATEPLDPVEGDLWWNTVSQSLFVFNTEWVEVGGTGGGGASVLVSLTPPVDPVEGDLWWDTDSGNLFVWYDDGDSQQWVIAIQVTDGQSIVPVADYISYTSGPQTFTISDIPYNSYLAVYINGARVNSSQWTLSGDQVTILTTLDPGDEVAFDFFTLASGSNYVPTTFASVNDLMVASQSGLAPGFYQVGEQISYWDGISFDPYVEQAPLASFGAVVNQSYSVVDSYASPLTDLAFSEYNGSNMDTGTIWTTL